MAAAGRFGADKTRLFGGGGAFFAAHLGASEEKCSTALRATLTERTAVKNNDFLSFRYCAPEPGYSFFYFIFRLFKASSHSFVWKTVGHM